MNIESLLSEYKITLYKRVDHEFTRLLRDQWLACMVVALILGSTSKALLALFPGMLFYLIPLYFIKKQPGHSLNRYINGTAQMCFSGLVIYILNGAPEARIHVFVSIAILANYRDWKLLVFTGLLSVADHFFRGIFWPMALYGTTSQVSMKWLYHAGWVAFEVGFLGIGCVRALKEMQRLSESQYSLIQSRHEAEILSSRRTEFFSFMSHEIRTPLNGIIGFTDILRESTSSPEQKQYVDIIKQCSDSLLKILNDFLDFSKIDQGHLEIDPHTFKSNDIAEYLDAVFRPLCLKKGLNFILEIENEVPRELHGDSYRLRQILANLISNAVKFTSAGEIRVRFARAHQPGFYVLEVSDTGIGIKEDNLLKIFSPFTQEHSGVARHHGGTGLGLAISKNLAELMGGTLRVNSVYGKGSHFIITLPFSSVSVARPSSALSM